jgi:hypothetical protein
MSLKSAAFLALTGTVLLTALFIAGLIGDIMGVARGLLPPMRLLTSVITTFAGVSLAVFFYSFHKAQS